MNSSSSQSPEFQKRLLQLALRRLKKIKRGNIALSKALLECDQADATEHLGDLLKANFHLLKPYCKEIQVTDWAQNGSLITIALDPKLSKEEQIKSFYKRAKKLRTGREPLEKALVKSHEELKKWEHRLVEIENTESHEKLLELQNQFQIGMPARKRADDKKRETPLHRFTSNAGHLILVGKNAAANEQLTFQVLKGDDLWLHAHHVAGSHVGVKQVGSAEIDEETLKDAMVLALYFSKARADIAGVHEVVVTTRSEVHRIKGAPKGKVSLSKFRVVKMGIELERINRLKGV